MNWVELLEPNNALVINKKLLKRFGLARAAIIIELINQQSCCQQKKELVNGFFYTTIKKFKDNTGLDEKQLRDELFELKSVGIIDYCNLGLSEKKYFKFDEEKLWQELQR
ncbi:hypothetical protein IKR55_00375 [bacterium]|nr:hypothetical protein [Elusimicrobiota bacterium]MBR6301171.1 hypothetical protein [bacterium]